MQYYLNSSEEFFKKNFDKRLKFLEEKKFLFSEISKFINNCINNSKEVFLFCAGNSILANDIKSEKINIKEINEKLYQCSGDKLSYKKTFEKSDIEGCDHLVVADIEHQNNPALNLLQLSNFMKDEARIIVLSKNFFWMFILNFLKTIFNFSPARNNFLPSSYLSNLYFSCNLEIIRSEKIIALPIYIPYQPTLHIFIFVVIYNRHVIRVVIKLITLSKPKKIFKPINNIIFMSWYSGRLMPNNYLI